MVMDKMPLGPARAHIAHGGRRPLGAGESMKAARGSLLFATVKLCFPRDPREAEADPAAAVAQADTESTQGIHSLAREKGEHLPATTP